MEEILELGSELKVPEDTCLERVEVVCRIKDEVEMNLVYWHIHLFDFYII